MTIEERQQEIVDEFSEIEDWFDRYAAIIDEGQNIVLIDEKKKTPEHLIEGCQSSVWLDAELKDGKVYYSADVNTEIIKGIVSMLIGVLNGHTPRDFGGRPAFYRRYRPARESVVDALQRPCGRDEADAHVCAGAESGRCR